MSVIVCCDLQRDGRVNVDKRAGSCAYEGFNRYSGHLCVGILKKRNPEAGSLSLGESGPSIIESTSSDQNFTCDFDAPLVDVGLQ